MRQARMVIRRVQLLTSQCAANGQASTPHALWRLERRIQSLFRNILRLQAEQEAAREFEVEIWRNVR